jgi:hypothetical protein
MDVSSGMRRSQRCRCYSAQIDAPESFANFTEFAARDNVNAVRDWLLPQILANAATRPDRSREAISFST